MPRSTIDQALVTGLTVATNRALVSLVQESIQAGALLSIGGSRRANANPALWSKVTLGLDVAAIGAGIAVQRKLAREPREPLPRASARTAGYWLTLAGTAGSDHRRAPGGAHAATAGWPVRPRRGRARRRRAGGVRRVPAPAGGAPPGRSPRRRLAGHDAEGARPRPRRRGRDVADERRRACAWPTGWRARPRACCRDARSCGDRSGTRSRSRGSAPGLGSSRTAGSSGIERKEESVETAFDIPPPNPLVSGCFESRVPFETTSKQGRRFAWTVTSEDTIRSVMHEEPAASPDPRLRRPPERDERGRASRARCSTSSSAPTRSAAPG